MVISVAMIAGSVSAAGFFIWIEHTLPDPGNLIDRTVEQSTKIFDRTGKIVLYDIHGEKKRTVISFSDIPDSIKWATIAIEDKKFYEHSGFDIKGIIRSVIVDISRGGKAQGGSTITQQLIKNSILSREKTYTRKIKELILAWKLENKLSKDQILELYLNEIPYGSISYGIESAAQTFFGKEAKELSLSEVAMLAALPKAPSYYSPYGNHKDELASRTRFVIDEMAEIGKITAEEAAEAKKDDPVSRVLPRRESIIAPHFVMYVKEILTEKYGDRMVEQGGLKVITSLDLDKQKFAEEAVAAQVEDNEKKWKAGNASLVSLDPKTGQILAMVGSRDYFDEEHDGNVNVALRPRQPGSSFKPIVYAASFIKGFTPNTILFDVNTIFKTEIGEDYEPKNYDLKEHGPVTVRSALAGSLNIPAVKMIYLTGIKNVLDLADNLGYSTLKERSRFGLSLVLGGGEVKLLEHTAAFGVFATEGVKHEISPILKVEDPSGLVLEEWKDSSQEVLSPQVVRQISSILSDNDARTFIFGAQNYLILPDRAVAAKTGTTNDYHDAWTVGYTPELVTGVWVGNNDNAEMKKGADGSKIAAPIWNAYMRKALSNIPPSSFNPPDDVITGKFILDGVPYSTVSVKINSATGLPADESTPPGQIVTKEYRQYHSILYYINKDDPRGPAPADPKLDLQYLNWELGVQNWAAANGFVNEAPPLTAQVNQETLEPEQGSNINTGVNQDKPEINQTATLDSVSVKWKNPRNNKQLTTDVFPFAVIASLSDPDIYEAEVIIKGGSALSSPQGGKTISLGTAKKESNGNFMWFWGEVPSPGDYTLQIRVFSQNKQYLVDPPINISIK